MPQIVVVQAAAPQPRPQIIVNRPPVIVVRRGYRRTGSLFGAIMTIVICAGAYWYAMRLRNNIATTVNAAEHQSEHASGGGEHKGKK